MSERNKLRNSLRAYYDNQEAPYVEQDWLAASRLLDAQRRKRKKRVGALVLTAVLILMVVTVSVRSILEPTGIRKEVLATGTRSSREPELAAAPIHLQNNKASSQSSVSKKLKNEISKRQAPKIVKEGKKSSIPALSPNKSEGVLPPAQWQTSQVVESLNIRNNETPVAPEPTGAGSSETITENAETLDLPLIYIQTLESPTRELAIKTQVNDYQTQTQAALPDSVSTQIPELSTASFSKEGLFYEVGTVWHYGWKNKVGRDARGFAPLLGIHYQNRLSTRFALSFGLQYLQVRQLSASSKVSRESIFRYGEQSQVTRITPFALHYLQVPFRLSYAINANSSFGAAVQLAYLLNVEARVTTYEERPGVTSNYKNYKQGGYTEGISWYDSQVAMFYCRKLYGSFYMKSEVFFGLTDTKQNDFFGLNSTERNSGMKLTLIYYSSTKTKRK